MNLYISKTYPFVALKATTSGDFVSFWSDGDVCVVRDEETSGNDLDGCEVVIIDSCALYDFLRTWKQ